MSKPPMNDFPLPQELKDEIWSYLLDGEPVQQTPREHRHRHSDYETSACGAWDQVGLITPAYRFYTAVLAANKTIGGNAAQFLAKRNTFVLVHFDCPDLRHHLEVMHVPIVACRSLANFTIHPIEIHISWIRESFDVAPLDSLPSRGTVLMLERDMPKFWTIMQLFCQRVTPGRIVPDSNPDVTLCMGRDLPGLVIGSPTVRIWKHDKNDRHLSEEDCYRFLGPMKSVKGLGSDIHFHGFDLVEPLFADLRKSVAVDIVTLSSMLFAQVDALSKLKKEADTHAKAGHLFAAETMFNFLEIHYCWFATTLASIDATAARPLKFILFDLLMAKVWLILAVNGSTRAARARSVEAYHLLLGMSATSAMYDHQQHLWMLACMADDPSRQFAFVDCVHRLLDGLKAVSTPDDRILHDIAVFEEAAESGGNQWPCFDDLSVAKFPFPEFDSLQS